ncbi:hypothetical protein FQA39_LY07487 [Lamprigera yunnana]|nr:hypothetical protein FQA39_LY07487 [Lamprigera yunnana]
MSEQFSLCWDNFHKNMSSGIQSMLETEDLVDVTLAVEGRNLKAHKMVLSVCSPYFRELFQSNPCKHPIVFMKDVSYIALSDLLQFMYQGEVQVAQENLATFIKTAEALQIKGLTGDSGAPNDSETDQEVEKPFPEAAKRNFEAVEQKLIPRSKRSAGPLSKKPKLNDTVITSTPTHQPLVSVVSTSTKYEVTSVNTNNTHVTDEIDLKMEPSENEVLQNDAVDENPIEQYADDSTTFEMADDGDDISLMESGNEEPKAGTSTEAGESQDDEFKFNPNQFSIADPKTENKKPRARTRNRFVYAGFIYHNKLTAGKNNSVQYLACAEIKRSGCRARAILPVGMSYSHLRLTHPHNHPPNENAEEREDFVIHLKQAVRSMPGSLRKVYDTIAILYPKGRQELPFKSICSSLHRWRRDLWL